MSSTELCSICNTCLDANNKQITNMRVKGLKNFIEKSKGRNDSKWLQWFDQSSIKVHEDCRKRYGRANYRQEDYESSMDVDEDDEDELNNEDCLDAFDFKKLCFLCGKEAKRKESSVVSNEYMTERFNTVAQSREDEWGELVKTNISHVRSLVKVKARYHFTCYSKFFAPLSTNVSESMSNMMETLNKVYDFIENNYVEKSPFSWKDMVTVMGDKPLYRTTLYKKLKEKYGEDVYIAQGIGQTPKIYYKNMNERILHSEWIGNIGNLTSSQKEILIDTVAEILREDVHNIKFNDSSNKAPNELLKDHNSEVPESLMRFLSQLLPTGQNGTSQENLNFVKRDAIAHSIISTIHPISFLSHLQLAVGTYVYNKSGSKIIIDLLSKLGVSPSYHKLRLLEASYNIPATYNILESLEDHCERSSGLS